MVTIKPVINKVYSKFWRNFDKETHISNYLSPQLVILMLMLGLVIMDTDTAL